MRELKHRGGGMSIIAKFQKALTGGECLRPVDYMILTAILVLTAIKA